MSFGWTGKSAVVTGAASGIGLALSEELVARGARVLMADIAEGALACEAGRLGAEHRVCDVCDPAAVERLAADANGLFEAVDLAFANAAVARRFSEIDAAFAAQAPVGPDADRYDVNRIVAEMRAVRRKS